MPDDKKNAVFVFMATIWLFLTTTLVLAQVHNFKELILPAGSLHYLTLHANAGIIGWFLLLIMGIDSLLIPIFLFQNTAMLNCCGGYMH